MEDPFWTHDTLLFEGTFRYYHDKKQPVHGKIHSSEEDYDFHSFGHSLERTYLKNRKGKRTCFFMRPYIERPNIILTPLPGARMKANVRSDVSARTYHERKHIEYAGSVGKGYVRGWYLRNLSSHICRNLTENSPLNQ